MPARNFVVIPALFLFAIACTSDSLDEDFVAAAKKGDLESLALLLEEGTNIEARDPKHGATALMWAAHEGHADSVTFLLEKGANINARQEREQTAVWYAAQQGRIEVVEILICGGADAEIKSTPESMDAEMVARSNNYDDIAGMLKQSKENLSKLDCKDQGSR